MDLIIHADEDEVMDLLGGEDVLTSQSEEEDSFNKNIVGCVPESETCECVICRYLPAEARMMRPLSRPGEDAEVSLPPFEPPPPIEASLPASPVPASVADSVIEQRDQSKVQDRLKSLASASEWVATPALPSCSPVPLRIRLLELASDSAWSQDEVEEVLARPPLDFVESEWPEVGSHPEHDWPMATLAMEAATIPDISASWPGMSQTLTDQGSVQEETVTDLDDITVVPHIKVQEETTANLDAIPVGPHTH